jgi:hypothetical protein
MKCQQFKDSRQKNLTEPTPLEVPLRRCGSIATDFFTHLPKTKDGYDYITTWVDRLSRRVHFLPSRSSDSAVDAALSSMRNNATAYAVGDFVWLKKTLFTDVYSKSQESNKLSAERFGTFKIVALIGKNAVKLFLPEHLKIHPVVHVIHTTPHYAQPADISSPVPVLPAPVATELGPEYEVESILSHRPRGRGYQFLTLMKGDPLHDAELQPARDFIDADGTMTEALQRYLQEHNLDLPLTRTSMRGGGEYCNS